MKSYFVLSCAVHGLFLAGLLVIGSLLSKPRMSYYGIDLVSSMPAGGGGVTPGPAVSSAPVPKSKPVKVAKAARAPAPVAREEAADQDTLRLLAKLKKKRLAMASRAPAPDNEESAPPDASEGSDSESGGTGRGGSGLAGSGAGIVADAGPAFPYPWYLKAIADRLDKQWHPPEEYQADTTCEVTFVISRGGQISGSQVSKRSGDSLFDQLALRAVLYANPLPPLPNGFPDETLKVHMKFVGKRT